MANKLKKFVSGARDGSISVGKEVWECSLKSGKVIISELTDLSLGLVEGSLEGIDKLLLQLIQIAFSLGNSVLDIFDNILYCRWWKANLSKRNW